MLEWKPPHIPDPDSRADIEADTASLARSIFRLNLRVNRCPRELPTEDWMGRCQ